MPFMIVKDLIGLKNASKSDLDALFTLATTFKQSIKSNTPVSASLAGSHFVTLFFEPSTRTRVSFEMAIKRLGATVTSITHDASSFKKGETLFDTVKNLEALGMDGIIIRHPYGGAPDFIARHLAIPVVNAGDGFNEHPTQGLLDIFSMIEAKGDLAGKNVLIWGDIMHSRVARSNIWGLKTLGANVFVGGPRSLIPSGIESMGVTVVPRLDDIIPHLDFINVLRVQFERQSVGYFPSIAEYRRFYSITESRLAGAKDNLVILHPGPINRGIECDSSVADGPFNIILTQVTNGVSIRMAVLASLIQSRIQTRRKGGGE